MAVRRAATTAVYLAVHSDAKMAVLMVVRRAAR
jgi:hypothetical protein